MLVTSFLKPVLIIAAAVFVFSACGSSELEPAGDATLQSLEYEFSRTVDPDEDEPAAGKITIDADAIFTEILFADAVSQIPGPETRGKLEPEVLEEITSVLNSSDFEGYTGSGGNCAENDRFRLVVSWSDGTRIQGNMNHEAFNGDFDGECGGSNTLRGDMKKTHEHLLNIVDGFSR